MEHYTAYRHTHTIGGVLRISQRTLRLLYHFFCLRRDNLKARAECREKTTTSGNNARVDGDFYHWK